MREIFFGQREFNIPSIKDYTTLDDRVNDEI
jgi:hypothetical protein